MRVASLAWVWLMVEGMVGCFWDGEIRDEVGDVRMEVTRWFNMDCNVAGLESLD